MTYIVWIAEIRSLTQVLVLFWFDNADHMEVVHSLCMYLKHQCACSIAVSLWTRDASEEWLSHQIKNANCVLIINSEGAFKNYRYIMETNVSNWNRGSWISCSYSLVFSFLSHSNGVWIETQKWPCSSVHIYLFSHSFSHPSHTRRFLLVSNQTANGIDCVLRGSNPYDTTQTWLNFNRILQNYLASD